MANDLISRKAAIDEAEEWIERYYCRRGGQRERDAIKNVIGGIKKLPSAEPDSDRYEQGIIEGRVQMRTELLTKLNEMVGEEIWTNI